MHGRIIDSALAETHGLAQGGGKKKAKFLAFQLDPGPVLCRGMYSVPS